MCHSAEHQSPEYQYTLGHSYEWHFAKGNLSECHSDSVHLSKDLSFYVILLMFTLLRVILLSITISILDHSSECHSDKCHSSMCHSAEHQPPEYQYTLGHSYEWYFAKGNLSECHSDSCHLSKDHSFYVILLRLTVESHSAEYRYRYIGSFFWVSYWHWPVIYVSFCWALIYWVTICYGSFFWVSFCKGHPSKCHSSMSNLSKWHSANVHSS
jgi:hypothetical protein